MTSCQDCGQELPENSRFCIRCGKAVASAGGPEEDRASGALGQRPSEELDIRFLYLMAGLLVLAVLFPPWEAPPGNPPEFLGFHFILSPPDFEPDGPLSGAVISRFLWTIELTTIAIAGFYLSWLFRRQKD